MKQTRQLMGMPITVEIVDDGVKQELLDEIYDYFAYVDGKYSTYKPDSEISRINAGLSETEWSDEMKHVLQLCRQTKLETGGYFDIAHEGKLDPSGLVKGWAVKNAADILKNKGVKNFCIDAGGDLQVAGRNIFKKPWTVGIRNPFDRKEVVKTLSVTTQGIATSGTAIRGQHIYNPLSPGEKQLEVASITIIGPDIYNADRFATAAFAMGRKGINFIESLDGYEAYMINADKLATMTSDFERFVSDV